MNTALFHNGTKWLILAGLLTALPNARGNRAEDFFAQSESVQHLLQDRGDRFRYFEYNLISTNRQVADFDDGAGQDQVAALTFHDDSEVKQGALRWHHPVLVQPFTPYELVYDLRADGWQGPPPYLEIELCDHNRDPITTVRHEIDAKATGPGWQSRRFAFDTPRWVEYVRCYFYSSREGRGTFWLDRVYLVQVGVAGALRPAATGRLAWDAERLTEPGQEVVLGQLALPDAPVVLAVTGRVTGHFTGTARLLLRWRRDGRSLGYDTAVMRPLRGVLPEWDGLWCLWQRDDLYGLGVLPMAGEPHVGSTDVQLSRQVRVPGADAVEVLLDTSPDFEGTLLWRAGSLAVEPE